jgi:hypothetical protein
MESGRMTEDRFQGTAPAEKRRNFEAMLAELKPRQDRLAMQEQQLRSRETDLLNALATEEGKWSELLGRLDQLLKR